MFLKLIDFVSHRCVASELVKLCKCFNELFLAPFAKETIENYFSASDIKKWRIAHIIAAYKSDDL